MQTLLIIMGILALIYFIIIYEQKTNIKRQKAWIENQYGKKPEVKKCDSSKIDYYWKEFKDNIPNDEKIDDITWNDLEMDNVFCRINNCNSFAGEQVLYSKLHCLNKTKSSMESLEKKIKFFSSNKKQRDEIQILLSSLGKGDNSYYLPIFISNLEDYKIKNMWKYFLMQILLVLSIFPAIILQSSTLLFVTGAIFLINIIIYSISKIKYEIHINTLSSIIGVVNVGNKIANTNKISYENNFNDLKKKSLLFKRMSHMIGRIQRKKEATFSGDIGGIMYDYLIGGTLWDFVSYERIVRLLKNRQQEFMELYRKIGEIDMIIAIASFRESLTLYCTPLFSKERVVKMEQMYHPLIDDAVCNTVTLDKNCIITGSNASGKSTYIKAIAINTILAQSIHTCMAKQMVLPYARIITSMAVRDDLMAGESYYIKEIKYLKRIIDNMNEDRLVICVVDEILRGTNTEERIAASASILKYLDKKNCIVVVASHDIELTQILDRKYDNYHFTEIMKENDIVFDYKLYHGVTTSKNAIKLLKYVGFPDEIIEEAGKIEISLD